MNEPHKKYTGESRFPLIMQNVHRYFFYGGDRRSALILAYDAMLALIEKPDGLGTWILIVNAVLIDAVFPVVPLLPSHHGRSPEPLLQAPLRYRAWTWSPSSTPSTSSSRWVSMFSVMGADFYVRLVAKGIIAFSFA